MPQFIYDIIVWINIISFALAFIDKCAAGSLTTLLWAVALPFGGGGAFLGCLLFRHHTQSGDCWALGFLTLVQLGILSLFER